MMHRFSKATATEPSIESWVTHSSEKNIPYQLLVSLPKEPPPASGYPVIFSLDGNAFFHTIHEQIRLQSRRGDKTGIHPTLIVGIGYPGGSDFVSSRRFFDFTPPAPSLTLPPKPNGSPWPQTGGSPFFQRFIEQEVKPFIQQHYGFDPHHQTLFGHSLGGLFALEVLFTQSHTFQSYIASSPSIWWNERAILEQEPLFSSSLSLSNKNIKLFLTVGSMEREHMIQDAKALYQRLQDSDSQGLTVQLYTAPEENHLSVVPTTISRGLRFVGR